MGKMSLWCRQYGGAPEVGHPPSSPLRTRLSSPYGVGKCHLPLTKDAAVVIRQVGEEPECEGGLPGVQG
jgi:hypothetical protein